MKDTSFTKTRGHHIIFHASKTYFFVLEHAREGSSFAYRQWWVDANLVVGSSRLQVMEIRKSLHQMPLLAVFRSEEYPTISIKRNRAIKGSFRWRLLMAMLFAMPCKPTTGRVFYVASCLWQMDAFAQTILLHTCALILKGSEHGVDYLPVGQASRKHDWVVSSISGLEKSLFFLIGNRKKVLKIPAKPHPNRFSIPSARTKKLDLTAKVGKRWVPSSENLTGKFMGGGRKLRRGSVALTFA